MAHRFSLSIALIAVSSIAHAHADLAPDGALHHALHAIGSERLVVTGGALIALAIGLLVRRAMRDSSAHRDCQN